MKVACYDTKSYDREHLARFIGPGTGEWVFHEFRLDSTTAETAAGCEAVCIFVNDRADGECLRRLQALGVRLVALRCAGFNQVDLKEAARLGLRVVRVPAYSPHAVAEHTVALLLALNRRLHRAYNRVREQNFSLGGLVGFDLYGKTVGIIGTGRIGRVTAQIFVGFGCRVVAYDPVPDRAWATGAGVGYMTLEELLAQADVVSLHLPLTPETEHLISYRTIGQMKRGAVLVNTSRGKLVDTVAVMEGLRSGHLGGVALDVYEEEEGLFFEDHSGVILRDEVLSLLLAFPNVLVTAHQAFLTNEALTEIARTTVGNVRCFADGSPAIEGTQLA